MLSTGSPESLALFRTLWTKAALDTRHELRDSPRKAEVSEELHELVAVAPSATTREIAVVAMAALAATGFEDRCARSLDDPSAAVRIAAIRAIAGTSRPDLRSRIAELAADPDRDVQEAAKRAMLRTVG
jgi:HEAT repeat protein